MDPVANVGTDDNGGLCSSASVDRLSAEVSVPTGAFWDTKSNGFKYKDRDGTSDSVTKVLLKEGAVGKAKISVQGKGNLVPMPTPVGGGQLLSADPRVTVQLINSETGVCWTGQFDGASAKRNSEDQFKATSP